MLAKYMKPQGSRLLLFSLGFMMVAFYGFSQQDSIIRLHSIQKYSHVGNNISYLIDHSSKIKFTDLPSEPFVYPAGKFLFDIKNLKGNYFVRLVVCNEGKDKEIFHFYPGKGIDFKFLKFNRQRAEP